MNSLPQQAGDGKHPGEFLSKQHYREVVEGSGVDPGLMGDTFKTVTAADARALGFSSIQARDGLLIELPAPDGEISYQLKANNPRTGDKGKPVKYETRARHDIRLGIPLPAFNRVVHGTGDIVAVEGAKKGFCALTLGYDPIIYTGVWNWGRKKRGTGGVKYGRPELLPDWEEIRNLEGRRITLLPDADYKDNPQVARAFKANADRLTERGARVYIADLPGPEKGLDDFVVAGGDLHKVIREARPYEPTLFTRYIAKDVPRLRDAVLAVEHAMSTDAWLKRSGRTDHSLLRALVELTLERGRIEDGEPVLVAGTRELQERAAIGSYSTLAKATARLVERGYVEKITGNRAKGEANRYRLKKLTGTPEGCRLKPSIPVAPIGGEGTGEGADGPTPATVTDDFTPHFRNPAPPIPDRPPDDIPGRQSRPTRPGTNAAPMRALGKAVEFYVNRLVAWGGDSTLRDLSSATGVKRTNPTGVRRTLADLEHFGIVEMEPKGKHRARVRLAPGWRAKLDEYRELGGELARGRRQAAKHRLDRLGYATKGTADKTPETMGPERVSKVIDLNSERERRRKQTEVSPLAKALAAYLEVNLSDAIQLPGWLAATLLVRNLYPERVTPAEIRAALEELGGDAYRQDLLRQSRETVRRRPAPETPPPEPVQVAESPEPVPVPKPSADGVIRHGPTCLCEMCDGEPVTSYAKIGALA